MKTIIGFILARLLTQADFGTYRQLFMIYTLLSAIFMIGLPQSIYYFIPKANARIKGTIISQTVDIFTILGLICSIFLLVFHKETAQLFHNPKLSKVLLLYAFYPFLMFLSQLYYSVMIALQQARKAASFVIFSLICDVILILTMALVTHRLTYIVLGLMISVAMQWLYARYNLNKYMEKGKLFAVDKDLLVKQLSYALPIGVASIIGVITMQLDKLVISGKFSPELFAIYSVGAAELPFIGIITNSVNAVLLPAMSSKTDKSEIQNLYRGAVRKNALLLIPLFVFCFVFAPNIIQILYSAKYMDSVLFFRVYLLTMPLRIATYGIIFQVFNQTKYIFRLSVLTLVLDIGLNFALIHILGIIGPAIASVLSTYVFAILSLFIFKKYLGLKLRALFPIEPIIRILLVSIFVGSLCNMIHFIPVIYYFQLAIGFIVFSMLYIVIGSVAGAIMPYDRQFLLSAFRSALMTITSLLFKSNKLNHKNTHPMGKP